MKDKWNTLVHNGVIFPPLYDYKKIVIIISGKEFILSRDAEEMAYAWMQKLETDYVKDPVFQSNFWIDFSNVIPDELRQTKFPDDWQFPKLIKEKLELTREEKEKIKKEKNKIKEEYGWATIDGKKVSLANYIIEPPGLFMGRGDAPLRGRWKPRIRPEDVVINLSASAIPPLAPPGHHWQKVVENKNALWTAMWIERLTGRQKRILFSANSFIRQENDKKKFEKAIQLAKNFEQVNNIIEKKLHSKDQYTRELAAVCNLISKMSIRVGDEKGEDEADTRGATTLCVENVKIKGNDITFNFLGKDSIPYHNTISFSDDMIFIISELIKDKKKSDKLFPHINSNDVNTFLSEILPGLSAKQFRTATGSSLLANELRENELSSTADNRKKMSVFTNANLEVALKLNHHSAVSKSYDSSLTSMKTKLEEMKNILLSLEKEKENVLKSREEVDASIKKIFGDTESSRRRISKIQKNINRTAELKYNKKIKTLKERIKDLTAKIKLKEKTKGIALGTSKLNYADPRIVISWCKDKQFPIDKIYTKTVQEKFEWAMDINEDFYKKYPH